MNFDKKNRVDLKQYFVAEAQPTELQFGHFIDGTINQADDGIMKLTDKALAIQADGNAESPQETLHLYSDFNQGNPNWSINLNPRVDANDADTNKEGFNIKDASGGSRLFLQSLKGNIGIGTIEPVSKLTIQSSNEQSLLSILDDENQSTKIFEVSKEEESCLVALSNAAANKTTHIRSNSITFEDSNDKSNPKSVAVTAEEQVLNLKAEEVKITGNISMKNLSSNNQLADNGESSDTTIPSQKAVKEYIDNRLPKGLISMWSGTEIPQGWALCDGEEGRPNLSGRFIVGLSKTDPEYNTVGKTGGSADVALTVEQLPAHNHSGSAKSAGSHAHNFEGARKSGDGSGSFSDNDYYAKDNKVTASAGAHTHTLEINDTGRNEAHENRPPFYVIAYIIKL